MKHLSMLSLLCGAAVLGIPQVAAACPQCAAREGAGIGGLVLLGGMILAPFFVAFITWRVIRRVTEPVHPMVLVGSENGGKP